MRTARPLAPPLRVEPRMHDARHASAVEGHSGFCRNLSALTLAVPPLLLLSHFGRRLRLQTSFAMLLVNQVHPGDRHGESTEGTKEGRSLARTRITMGNGISKSRRIRHCSTV